MTSITLPRTRAPIDLKHATHHELADAYGQDDNLDAAILAELQARDDARDRQLAALRARRTDPVTAMWSDAVAAQMAAAEAACEGNLVRRDAQGNYAVEDPISLWGGAEFIARQRATPELQRFWDEPRGCRP